MLLTNETLDFNSVNSRMLFQFRNKEKINAFLRGFWEQEDDIKNAIVNIEGRLDIDSMEGFELDKIGEIIGQPRYIPNIYKEQFFGFADQFNTVTFEDGRFKNSVDSDGKFLVMNDDFYRKVLKARILKRTSRCTIPDTIQSFKYAFDLSSASIENAGNAKINLYLARAVSQFEIELAKQLDLFILATGVGIKAIYIAPSDYFGFRDDVGGHGFDQYGFYESYQLPNSYGLAETDGDSVVALYFGFFGQDEAGGFGQLPFKE